MEAEVFLADQQRVEIAGRELLERMARQDQTALKEFYEQYCKLVYSFVLRILNCRAEADEITLEVFWQAWQQAEQYCQKRGSVSAWLIMIARSRAIDRRRSNERRNGNLDAVDTEGISDQNSGIGIDPEKSLYWLERREAVLNALSEMNDKQRQAIELAYFSGLSQSEIAAVLQEPLGTIKTRIRTGMQALREKLKQYV